MELHCNSESISAWEKPRSGDQTTAVGGASARGASGTHGSREKDLEPRSGDQNTAVGEASAGGASGTHGAWRKQREPRSGDQILQQQHPLLNSYAKLS